MLCVMIMWLSVECRLGIPNYVVLDKKPGNELSRSGLVSVLSIFRNIVTGWRPQMPLTCAAYRA